MRTTSPAPDTSKKSTPPDTNTRGKNNQEENKKSAQVTDQRPTIKLSHGTDSIQNFEQEYRPRLYIDLNQNNNWRTINEGLITSLHTLFAKYFPQSFDPHATSQLKNPLRQESTYLEQPLGLVLNHSLRNPVSSLVGAIHIWISRLRVENGKMMIPFKLTARITEASSSQEETLLSLEIACPPSVGFKLKENQLFEFSVDKDAKYRQNDSLLELQTELESLVFQVQCNCIRLDAERIIDLSAGGPQEVLTLFHAIP